VLTSLQDAGLVARAPHPSDGRQALVSVTPDGSALLREDRRRREAWLATQLAALDDDERALLRAAAPLLDRLASA
jgi:DNA-binding MarR family transcriptional regulator